ncbi:MAG TPA: GlmU family protein [Bacteroidia bacterium]|nr:GlmU family protein [Bacteroidia bacterium]
MNYILFDDENRKNLFPFTLSRPVAEIRVGILTLKEKWDNYLNAQCAYFTEDYLSKKYKKLGKNNEGNPCVYINAAAFPNTDLINEINKLEKDTVLVNNNKIVAIHVADYNELFNPIKNDLKTSGCETDVTFLNKPWEIFANNGKNIIDDFNLLTHDRKSAPIDASNQVICPENIFIEEGAIVQCCILNASSGPIYIAKHAEVMEGSMIRGPFALGEHSAIKMGAKIYGPTTIGPESKVGGEVNNSVIFGYSNKAHDGFLGNSVIGEWCNLGADTNNSNLKNNYGQVKIWDMTQNDYQLTGLMFCGLMMGDHSKAGINTMFNTGTVTGFCANIFDGGFPPKFIPNFSWGGQKNAPKFELEKAIEVASRVYERRGLAFGDDDRIIFEHLFA